MLPVLNHQRGQTKAQGNQIMLDKIQQLTLELEQERQARRDAEMTTERVVKEFLQKQRQIELLQRVTAAANESVSFQHALRSAVQYICNYTGWVIGIAYLVEKGCYLTSVAQIDIDDDWHVYNGEPLPSHWSFGKGLPGQVLLSRKPEMVTNLADYPDFSMMELAKSKNLIGANAFPILLGTEVVGVFEFFVRRNTPKEAFLREITEQIGAQMGRVIERQRANERIQQQYLRLTALHDIDAAFISSFDIQRTLQAVTKHVESLLKVDLVNILLVNPEHKEVEYVAGRGSQPESLKVQRALKGFDYAKNLMERKEPIYIENLGEANEDFTQAKMMYDRGMVSYLAVPLRSRDEGTGLLEVFHSDRISNLHDWREFLIALSSQISIMVENHTLFAGLQRSNKELVTAYDATIEGWSRALDLRDHETEGHTQRVTAMTVRLARAWGIPEEEILHIRRGAILHDIGKMGIPDNILLKPGRLDPDERKNMERHPQLAYDMLSPISYLSPALDIPISHHERWDGKGYPKGLKGEDIPITARLFAVVDVWDALRSDRPYRSALPEPEVREYIRKQSGTHFDPAVVDLFLRLLEEEDLLGMVA